MRKEIKFKHYIFTPIRILKRAKDLLYLKKGVMRSNRAASSVQITHHHLEAKTRSTTNLNNNALRATNELLRTVVPPIIAHHGEKVVTLRSVLNETNKGVNYNMQRQRQRMSVGYRYNRVKMSYHTSVRKMETVDEDKPCCFQEDQSDHSGSNLLYLYPRTRNYGVNRRVGYRQ